MSSPRSQPWDAEAEEMLRERENSSTENTSFPIGGGSLVSAPANPMLLPVGQLQPVTGGAENEFVMRETWSTCTQQADIQTGGGPPPTVPANPVQGPMETDRVVRRRLTGKRPRPNGFKTCFEIHLERLLRRTGSRSRRNFFNSQRQPLGHYC